MGETVYQADQEGNGEGNENGSNTNWASKEPFKVHQQANARGI